jgi:uncharacterized repeat protein (TIGR01451 family)
MKLFNKIRNLSTKAKLAVAAVTLGVIVAAPLVVQAEFFPNRPTYDYNKSGTGDCHDPSNPATQFGRCGSMNGPVFNSFINTPSYGDERTFVDARRSDQTAAGSYKNVLPDVTKGSKEIVVRMYVHNNANSTTNASGLGIAKNTKVRLALPNVEGSALRTVGYISADNATPQVVEDTVDFTSTEKFTVNYKAGSAILYNNGAFKNGTKVSDTIVTTGAPIGYDALNGNLPGCFDYEAVVQVTLTVTPKPVTNLQLVKEVKKVGDKEWKKEVSAKPSEEVQWLLTTKNIGNAQLTNVAVRDILPPHVELVPNSVRIIDTNQDTKQQDTPLFKNGLGLGTYPSAGGRFVIFNTKTKGDFEGCETRVRNVAKAKSDQTPTEIQSDADVVITKDNCKPNETNPKYDCTILKVEQGTNRTAKYTVTATATGGATIERYIYDFGDGTPEFATDQSTVSHTYVKDGQYAARVKVQFRVNGETKTVDVDRCAASVNYTNTPTTPGKLPETGAGSVAAIFGAVTAVSTAGYYFVSRRFSQV